ncbi:hypothetical protein G6F70_007358 [Rhizopus microsporus]|uniref:ENTH-domain-containing protein n=1 Tax=Rhizopus microsporus TaxID=58291 RepID=A0A1X0S145_RHIZD|nr:hypothetical protein G6F71_007348 [Rhizopus microsporus]KAG1196558.1 hypothetical protein G6F70_007358 [Rhizopus microsporus]KAG1208445.1 hypothetical protein G6F69_007216 [Rhizopus microsporus]KAG1231102.1 hypothetical protein G6F67_006001 [Rhizopus microsporus]KAG1265517.1 hypothetical protein G6F68_003507 [Rhizopus microsporus]
MEAKVHEATNNEAWGASSTLMQEIAQGTYNYQYFNEIMPTIYKRFTEKEARYWRQIYKSLVLLEYLVKNGSERVVDDARSHISMIKMMKNFHYVDEKGKDQGINVRNRAKELVELLNNTDAIKEERKKAKKNRSKYTGVGSDGGMMFASSGGYSGGSYSSNPRFEGFGSDSAQNDFYDSDITKKYDEPSSPPPTRATTATTPSSASSSRAEASQSKVNVTANDLFDFDEPAMAHKQATNDDDWGDFAAGNEADDDFDDFQSAPAPPSTTATAHGHASTATAASKKTNDIFDLLGDDSFTAPPAPQQQGSGLMLSQAMSYDTLAANRTIPSNTSSPIQQTTQIKNTAKASETESNTSIGGIWSQASSFVSLDSLGKKSEPAKPSTGPSMNTLRNSSSSANWGNWGVANSSNVQQQQPQQRQQQQQQQTKQSSAFDDLLF